MVKAAQKRKSVIKSIANFKKIIQKRLSEIKNPNTANILRLIDDSMINEFIDKYKGNSMSVDAIIYNMIATVEPILAPGIGNIHNTESNANVEGIPNPSNSNAPMNLMKPEKIFPGGFRAKSNKFRLETSIPTEINSRKSSPNINLIKRDNSLVIEPSTAFPLLSPSAKSILLVHNQMALEGSLPSLQCDKVLSDDQLYRMGAEKDGVGRVTDEILFKNRMEARRRSQSIENDIEIYTPGKIKHKVPPLHGLKPPLALKSGQYDETLSKMPKSPYKDGDEIGKILSSGVASGAGIPINKKYYTRIEDTFVDRYGNLITPNEYDPDAIDQSDEVLSYIKDMY